MKVKTNRVISRRYQVVPSSTYSGMRRRTLNQGGTVMKIRTAKFLGRWTHRLDGAIES